VSKHETYLIKIPSETYQDAGCLYSSIHNSIYCIIPWA